MYMHIQPSLTKINPHVMAKWSWFSFFILLVLIWQLCLQNYRLDRGLMPGSLHHRPHTIFPLTRLSSTIYDLPTRLHLYSDKWLKGDLCDQVIYSGT